MVNSNTNIIFTAKLIYLILQQKQKYKPLITNKMIFIVRFFKGKDEDMLTGCAIIIEQAIVHKAFLISKRSAWDDPFFGGIKTTIDDAFQNILGIDNAKERRQATQTLRVIQRNALKDLAELKVQIKVDFESNKVRLKEILTQLGYSSYHLKSQQKDQEALVSLLYTFKQNMTPALIAEITAAGTDDPIITSISAYAEVLKNANITQETFKGGAKEITQDGVIALNAIYKQVIGIAKIAYKFYYDDKAVRSEFSYSTTIKKLNYQPKTAPPLPLPS